MTRSLVLFLALITASYTHADDIEFPEEELARETTLPVFDKRRAVLNRSVVTHERFEFGVGGGLEVNEPYYNDIMFGVQGTYNYSENSAINVQGLMWMDGLSSYGEQLKAGDVANARPEFHPDKAPHPKFGLLANYQFIAYYGKISLTKQWVMNLNLFGLAGLGYINMGDVSTVGVNLGFGQNFFFTKNFGLRFDMRWLIFQGPNPTTVRPLDSTVTPSASAFGDRIYYNTQLGLSAVFIL